MPFLHQLRNSDVKKSTAGFAPVNRIEKITFQEQCYLRHLIPFREAWDLRETAERQNQGNTGQANALYVFACCAEI